MDLVDPPRVKEDPFGERRLPRVDVGGDPDVPQLLHGLLPPCLLLLLCVGDGGVGSPAGDRGGGVVDEDDGEGGEVKVRVSGAEGGKEAGG